MKNCHAAQGMRHALAVARLCSHNFLSIYMSGTWPLPPEQELDFSVSETDPEAGELGKAKLSTGVRIGHACLTKHEETGEDQLWL